MLNIFLKSTFEVAVCCCYRASSQIKTIRKDNEFILSTEE